MPTKMDRKLYLHVSPLLSKNDDKRLILRKINESLHTLITRLAQEVDFHEEINNFLNGKNNNIEKLNESHFNGIEFKIRIVFNEDLEVENNNVRIDLIYPPLESLDAKQN